jgi:hypothetical protein
MQGLRIVSIPPRNTNATTIISVPFDLEVFSEGSRSSVRSGPGREPRLF